MSAASNHTESQDYDASILPSMLKDKPTDWKESVVLGGEDIVINELGVMELAIELMKRGEPVCLTSRLVNGLEEFVSEGFSIKLAANAEELELTQPVVDREIVAWSR